jgi:Tol biopolymer transport system component
MESGSLEAPRISPDGKYVSFTTLVNKVREIWIYDLQRNLLRRFTDGSNDDLRSIWMPDGNRILFETKRTGYFDLVWLAADGSGSLNIVTDSEYVHNPCSWSPDGKTLIYQEYVPHETGFNLLTVIPDENLNPYILLKTAHHECQGFISPNGKWLAYISNETGRNELYVRSYPDLSGIIRISNKGAIGPCWSPDGQELFFQSMNGDSLFSVSINSTPDLQVGVPELLFSGNFFEGHYWFRDYDISPDGNYFIMVRDDIEPEDPTSYHVVTNWSEDILKKMDH